MHSPPAMGVAPMRSLIAEISAVGPARRLVPVSAIASQPPLQNALPPTLILK
jgi:hypothetical protein